MTMMELYVELRVKVSITHAHIRLKLRVEMGDSRSQLRDVLARLETCVAASIAPSSCP